MRQLGGLVAVLVVMSAVAGCFAENDEEALGQTDTSGASDGGNGTANATAPVAAITVTIDGNLTEPVNGSIPATVGVNITFDGSSSVGDNLTYEWAFGENATGSNASETYAFSQAGRYNVTLTVTSGNATDTASVLLNVTSPQPAGGVIWMDTKSFTGTLPVGNPNAAFQANTDYRDHVVAIVAADPNGTAVVAKRVRWTLDTSGAAALDMTLYWRNAGGNLATAGTANTADESLVYEGDMPPGDYVIRVRFNTGANASYTVRGEIDYEAS